MRYDVLCSTYNLGQVRALYGAVLFLRANGFLLFIVHARGGYV